MPAGKQTNISNATSTNDGGYASIAEQQERYAAVLGIENQLPTNTSTSKTVDFEKATTTYNDDRFTTRTRTNDTRNQLLTFPDDLAKQGKNRYWTKITVYEVRYNAKSDEAGSNSKLTIYKKGKADSNAAFYDGSKLATRKYAYDSTSSQTAGSDYTNNYVMTNLTIALPMPIQDPQWEFMLNWSDQADWGWTGAIADILGQIGLGQGGKAGEEIGQLAERFMMMIKQKIPVAGQLLKAGRKEFINDRTEMMFNGFGDTRRPNFSWQLYPKNQKESETLLDIIETLKSLVLPSIKQTASEGGNKNVLMFPALFEICFMNGDKENAAMPRFGPLAVQNFKITSIQDKWQAHKDGSPIGYNIDMMGVELVHPIRDNLEDDAQHLYIR